MICGLMPKSLEAILRPKSIAVLGASRHRRTVGGELFHNLMTCGFQGPVYPVNPTAKVVQSVRAYASVEEIDDPIDLAIIAVPRDHVASALRACARKGIKGAVVVTAGFKEVRGEGIAREAELVAIARQSGLRLIGPNCLGVLNTDPEIQMNATFAEAYPQPGPVSFLSQSGALGAAVLDLAMQLNLGFSSFVSIGNKCDVSGNDLLEFWHTDPRTRVILMYLESFGNPRKFTQIARRVGLEKPIVAVKGGRTLAGSRAAASHTGALAGADNAVDALFRQAGVIRVDTTEELFDTAMLLATQPLPLGRRVGIVTNAGGPGILASDACEDNGLTISTLQEATVKELSGFLPEEASLRNPVDMIASATAENYRRAVDALLRDETIDALLVIFVPPLMLGAKEVADAIASAAQGAKKPLVSCFMGAHGFAIGLGADGEAAVQIPSYRFPEAAAKALSRAANYAEWRSVEKLPLPRIEAKNLPELSTDGEGWLSPQDVETVLRAYGISTPKSRTATSADDAVAAAESMGYPVAMKLVADALTHKSDIGGVVLDRRDEAEVRQAYDDLMIKAAAANLADQVEGVLIQQFVGGGVEAVIGVAHDPSFGPLIMFGMGGTYVELFQDVAFRLHPLTIWDAEEMIWSVRTSELLRGYRGAEAADVDALKQLLAQVNQLVSDLPQLMEMDLNPVKILETNHGLMVVDARIRLSL